ncbi:alpha-galactosidase [Halobacillus yeomjeoni]|nr:alpha-galactosidase [Halobacillus yeomjeoni]MCA0985258.1 alpha-galactosidase [Halobacillus yeomjeoni]
MMIFENESPRQFHLQNDEISYVLHVLKNGHLGHLYFGTRLNHREDFSHFQQEAERAGTSYVYEGDMNFSLDLARLEYPVYGSTDYREPALQIEQLNGSRISDFKYASHRIYAGKPELEGLPATYVDEEEEARTLEITLHDRVMEADLILTYTIFKNYNAITRSSKVVNHGREDLNLSRVLSASIDMPDSDYEMIQLSGSWSRERHVKSRRIESGVQSIGSTRGTSSSQQNPFYALKRPNTTEDVGDVIGMSLVYSGNFLGQVEVDHYDVARASIGLQPFDFNWKLEPGEAFQSPEAVIVFSNQGMNGMSQIYHNLYHQRLVRGKWRDRERPILINNWEATYFDFDEDKIVSIASQAKELGVELFVLDDGWFGKRDDDTTSLGDWFYDERKLPGGISRLAEKVTEAGLDFGLWFEPEMVSKQSELFEKHPDWAIQVEGRPMSHGRNQYILDFSRKEVVDYIYELMHDVLSNAPVTYVKWDMNRYMTEISSAALPSDRQKELPHRYILGVYDLYERLIRDFPEILFESCASGGARFDPGMLYYAPQTWTSDDTDAVERLKIQYGTSMVYPLSTIGAHVSEVPNHQVKRITSLKTRGEVAFFGTFGYELDVTNMSEAEKEETKNQIDFYKQHRELIQKGDFYRLVNPFEGTGNDTAWMVVSDNRDKALVGHYRVLARPNDGFHRLYVKGLDPDKKYHVRQLASHEDYNESHSGSTHFGDELMFAGLNLGAGYSGTQAGGIKESGDFSSTLWLIEEA